MTNFQSRSRHGHGRDRDRDYRDSRRSRRALVIKPLKKRQMKIQLRKKIMQRAIDFTPEKPLMKIFFDTE